MKYHTTNSEQLSLKDEPAIIINTTNSEQLSLKDEPAIIIIWA